MAYTHLDPGQELEISAHIYFSPSQMDISELVKLSPEQLKAQEADSVEQEKAIYEKFNEIEKEWAKQAMLTLSLRKAQQYLKVQPAPHTSNQWTEDQYGRHEMSNMVYCFSWREYERTGWSRAEQKSVPVAWELSWSLHFNTIPNPDYVAIMKGLHSNTAYLCAATNKETPRRDIARLHPSRANLLRTAPMALLRGLDRRQSPFFFCCITHMSCPVVSSCSWGNMAFYRLCFL